MVTKTHESLLRAELCACHPCLVVPLRMVHPPDPVKPIRGNLCPLVV